MPSITRNTTKHLQFHKGDEPILENLEATDED